MELLRRKQFPEFHSCVEDEINALRAGRERAFEPSFVRRGLYLEQLERLYQHFARESILVLESSELKRDRTAVLNRVLGFLGLPQSEWKQTALQDQHVRQYDSPMAASTRTALQEFFEQPNARLYSAIGRAFDWDGSRVLPGGDAS